MPIQVKVDNDGIPFEIKKFNKTMKIMTEDEFLDRLTSSRAKSREGKVIDADKAINDIRKKLNCRIYDDRLKDKYPRF